MVGWFFFFNLFNCFQHEKQFEGRLGKEKPNTIKIIERVWEVETTLLLVLSRKQKIEEGKNSPYYEAEIILKRESFP